MIWNQNYTLDQLNSKNAECMVGHCDIEMTQIDDDALHARMKVSHKIKQPFGIVHGGANCVLAETLGSVASNIETFNDANQFTSTTTFTTAVVKKLNKA